MSMSIEVEIKGISPLLMHAFPMVPVEAIERKDAQDQAELSAYRDPEGVLFIPAVCLQRALVNGATFSKGKGRSSLQKNVAACVFVTPERLSLGAKKFEIDSRPVVIAATKGRIIRHRPRLDAWAVKFTLEYDETLLDEKQMRRIVDDTGSRVGLLDFRPQKNGPFGRFMVTEWHNGK
jgi:hypothetical protein